MNETNSNDNKLYEIVESPNESFTEDLFPLRITQGKFRGTTFRFGVVRVLEDESEDQATLQYDFEVETPCEGWTKDGLEADEDFQRNLGDILIQIFEEHAEIKKEEESELSSSSSSESQLSVDENI